jgi:Domain of unknown function (DUF4442)
VTPFLKRHIRGFFNLYPPFLGAGIKITRLDRDWRAVDVEMKLRFWNRNYVRTHYGGSLYSMTDPFYMLMLIENLGPEYIVWDKAASIRFRRPGRGRVRAEFRITEQQLADIRQQLQTTEKMEPIFTVDVTDDAGEVIAQVEKVIQVKRKPTAAIPNPAS